MNQKNTVSVSADKVWDGLLVIGDPHISSKRVGRRNDEDFLATVTGKLTQAGQISSRNNLFPCILGDFMHKATDITPRLMIMVMEALRSFPVAPWTILGNVHDHVEHDVSDNDTLKAIVETGLLRLADQDGMFDLVDINGLEVSLTTIPYGHAIPESIEPYLLEKGVHPDLSVLLTHADLEFDSAYPGAIPITEVDSCDLLINGHMHKTQRLRQVGHMVAFNPGNITRLSVDMESHIPSVWAWRPDNYLLDNRSDIREYWDFNIECIPLNFNPNVFSKDGIRANVDSTGARDENTRHFVESLSQLDALSHEKTEDGEGVKEELKIVLEGKHRDVSSMCNALLESVVKGEQGDKPNFNLIDDTDMQFADQEINS